MGLTEVPCELFRMKKVKRLYLNGNKLCSLPSEIAHLTTLKLLYVRLSKRLDCELTERHVVLQVVNNQLTSLPPELGLLTNLKSLYVRPLQKIDRDLTRVTCFQVGLNQLTSLPSEIGQLSQLKGLSVRNSI
jgi:Leucine-rich repeat (LRR) protein